MKVLFFISIMRHGRGGHVHSLNHIVEALSHHLQTEVVTVGKGRSEVLEDNKSYLTHINTNNCGWFEIRKAIKDIIKDIKPDVLHCFDLNVFNLIRGAVYPTRTRIVLNKCGGPNPKDFASVSHLILFTEENKRWFESHTKFKQTAIYLIPNRVDKKALLGKESTGIERRFEKFTFIRICRIGKPYQKSLEDSIRLVHKLIERGRSNVLLYIIGTVEDLTVLLKLKEQSEGLPIEYFIDDAFTGRASDMLFLADAVIATGRGLMEATALGKPILTPALNTNIPVLVTQNNFHNFFATNFSERNVALQSDLDTNMEGIESIIDNEDEYNRYASFSEGVFSGYFDVNGGVDKYIQVYTELLNMDKQRYTIFKDVKLLIRSIYNFLN